MRRIVLLLLPVIAACSSVTETKITDYITPYKIDIRQGNYVTQEMVSQLKPGQTEQQVRYLLGSPLLVDVFHKNRWDYIYQFKPNHGELQSRRLTLYFTEGKLSRVSGDVDAAAPGEVAAPVVTNRIIDMGAAPAPASK